ncbi:hypothetical protein AGABI2DRAFT_117542 [Agaricus bisporus var. bisporus H97]|uniref:hypothetical protein n=1 Tax=Agaricus bisporus var. bisporus (strain H97 / ATCC MYA-4626 / FGSC 10389) TaxID=936046 RepID=UPI00029F7659|nr:hypothetical protein AGABI2DRAFT_117542 [Agaricus bisporus var. bisporus H97]EKV48740.1 hypothetical protein AGABI2DRAFT_117542 [Agaricus bisporus var. bisporus H97]
MDPELRTSIYAIEAACAQLCSLIARPSDALANKLFSVSIANDISTRKFNSYVYWFYEPACIRIALENKIHDILDETPSGIHVSELERRTGVDGGKLGRILRLLATKHVFQEVTISGQ